MILYENNSTGTKDFESFHILFVQRISILAPLFFLYINANMKRNLFISIAAYSLHCSDAFVPSAFVVTKSQTTTSLNNFLDGKFGKTDVMKREDEAMWVDDSDEVANWNPFAKKKSTPPPPPPPPPKKAAAPSFSFFGKKAPEPEPEPIPEPPKSSGFKFPWDK